MAWVYILKTQSGKFYIGSTVNIDARLKHHLSGSTPSTKRLKAEALLLKQQYATIAEARSVESRLKKLKRRDHIEKIIKDGYIRLTPR